MQEYQINSTKMYKIIRQENKKHIFHYAPWIMIVISIIGFFLLKNFFSIHMVPGVMDEDHIQGCKSVTILLSSLFAFLLYIIPTICAQRYVDLLFNYKSTEQLIITDGAIENTYNPIWESMYFCKRRVRILCCEITRLEWYPNHRCLKIYAPVSITHFLSGSRSYPKETIKKTRIITGKKGFRVFYAYYNDFEHFIKQIEMLSGKSVIECTGHTRLREKK